MSRPWTEQEDADLRHEWTQGCTASQIASTLNSRYGTERTRNSVLGRGHRLQLAARTTWVRPVVKRDRVKRKPLPKMAEPAMQKPHGEPETGRQSAKEAPAVPCEPKPDKRAPRASESANPSDPMRRVEISELARNECRWPVNDPSEGEVHLFCGRKQADGSSYCAVHLERSISKQSESARKVQPVSRKVAYS